MFLKGIILFCFVSVITSLPTSPCPDLFQYESEGKNEWSGTLTLLSDYELHGLWVRLIFDAKYTEIIVPENFDIKTTDNHLEVLLKDPDYLLKSKQPSEVKITVKYDGSEVPKLSSYRLNARTFCSDKDKTTYFFGDLISNQFLSNILAKKAPVYSKFLDCGTAPLADLNNLEGQNIKRGQWPWAASIFMRKNDKGDYLCGGTLISQKHIITAAHCVNYNGLKFGLTPKHLGVSLGVVDLTADSLLKVEKVNVYPGYSSENLLNDLAVITLEKPVDINDNVRPICLEQSKTIQGKEFVVGVGVSGNAALLLSQDKVDVVDLNKCVNDKQIGNIVNDNHLCGTYPLGNPVCVGDSGSALVSLRESTVPVWQLRGIVSVGPLWKSNQKCNKHDLVLFTDVTRYLKWIQSVISE